MAPGTICPDQPLLKRNLTLDRDHELKKGGDGGSGRSIALTGAMHRLDEVEATGDHNREGEGGAGAVQSEGGWLACSLACFSHCARVLEGKGTWDSICGGGKSANSWILGEEGRCVAGPQ